MTNTQNKIDKLQEYANKIDYWMEVKEDKNTYLSWVCRFNIITLTTISALFYFIPDTKFSTILISVMILLDIFHSGMSYMLWYKFWQGQFNNYHKIKFELLRNDDDSDFNIPRNIEQYKLNIINYSYYFKMLFTVFTVGFMIYEFLNIGV